MHGPFNKPEVKISYLRRQFSWLPQEVSKLFINCLSYKVSYDSMFIDPVINGLVLIK